MYPPQDQMRIGMGHDMTFVIRTSSDPSALATVVRRVFEEIDQEVPISEMRTMDEVVSRWVATRRFVMILVALFAAADLLLSVVGMYGVISYTVKSRRREIGLRVALGAAPSAICFSVVRQGVGIAVLGIGLGAGGALIGGRLVSGLLFGVSYADPFSYFGVALLLSAGAAVSSYLPARRAARVDPMRVLREE